MSYQPGVAANPSGVNGHPELLDGLQGIVEQGIVEQGIVEQGIVEQGIVEQVDNMQVSNARKLDTKVVKWLESTNSSATATNEVVVSLNGPAPVHQPLLDIRELSLADRNRLCVGQFVQIQEKYQVRENNQIVERVRITGRIPINLLLAISPGFQAMYTADPNVSVITLTDSTMLGPVESIIKWLMANAKSNDFVPLPIRKTLSDNLLTIRAARQLGIDDVYTEHICGKYWGYVTRKIPTFDDITRIERYALDRGDLLFKAMATTLARLRFKEQLVKPAELEDYLAKHPKLASFMEAIDNEYEAKRKEMAEIKAQRHKEWRERQARAKQHQRRAEEGHRSAVDRLEAAAEGSRVLSEEEIRAIMRRG
jgi:hypothetical protein